MKKILHRGLFWGCAIALLLITFWYRISTFALSNPQSIFVTASGTHLIVQGQPYMVNGINYYPKDTPWDKFWPNYNGNLTDKDFSLLNNLHVNAVRIFVPFYEFGKVQVGKISAPQYTSVSSVDLKLLDKLADMLKRAKNHKLRLIITLFDFNTDYNRQHWAQKDQYVKTILTRFQADPTILAWDLKNEPDLDYPASGKTLVDSWLMHTAQLAHTYAPSHLLTIGWSNAAAARTRISHVNFVSFHYYLSVSELPYTYSALRTAIPDLPIVMTEFGLSTSRSTTTGDQQAEAEQAQYYAGIFKFWRTTQSPGTFCWTLYDFSYIPNVFGNDPQQIEAQKHFGLVRTNGTLKPAASQVSSNTGLQYRN